MEEARVICMKVSAMPVPPVESVQEKCIECEAPVWRSVDSVAIHQAQAICVGCAQRDISQEEPREYLMPERTRQRFRDKGLSDEQIDHMISLAAQALRRGTLGDL